MVWGALIGAAAGLLGSKMSADKSQDNAREQMAFQEEMSRTAHQREVDDLKAAGLNPMLSARLGGASTPGGASGSVPDMGQAVSSGVSAGMMAQRTNAEIEQIKANTDVARSQEILNQTAAIKQAAETRATTATAQMSEWEYQKKQYLEREFDQWFTEGKEFDARRAVAMRDAFKASRDYNTVQYLDEFAISKGYRNFDEAAQSLEFRKMLQEYTLRSLEFPKAEALSAFYRTDYGREIAPFLSSAGGVSDLLGTAGAGLSIGKKLLGGMKK